jgi:hypothetical protein
LANARIVSIGDISEASVADVPARIHELRMVEYVEEFTPNLERLVFPDLDSLGYAEIGVVEAWTVEEAAVRRSECSAVRAWGGPGEKAVGRDK